MNRVDVISIIGVLALLVAGATLIWWTESAPDIQENLSCWFLDEQVKDILAADLAQWTEITARTPDATMEQYFSIRIGEMVELYVSKSVTAEEARNCLESL